MKKFIVAFVALLSISAISCRQSDDIMNDEDVATIKIIETNRNSKSSNSDQSVKRDSATTNVNTTNILDGEIIPPPRR